MTAIFPSLPGLAWSVTKAPRFATRIQRAVSGRELRTLAGFFLQQQGAFQQFLFDDPTDGTVTGQAIGTGDSSANVFQLVRSMGGCAEPMTAPNTVSAVY